jgi:hypothetical protein
MGFPKRLSDSLVQENFSSINKRRRKPKEILLEIQLYNKARGEVKM